MSVETQFGNYFKPEMKSSGRKLLSSEKVSISSQSDSFIQAYIRVAPPFKVTLTTNDIASPTFMAECNCPVAKKSRFCKHVWATLLAVEEKCPDFLENKTEINKLDPNEAVAQAAAPLSATSSAPPPPKTSYAETAKARASEYRKEQYQKQKARVKDKKRERLGLESAQSSSGFTPEVEAALAYFTLNGFPMPAGPSREILSEAKRTLSRVFHPDKGGTHEEVVELNTQCEILLNFLQG